MDESTILKDTLKNIDEAITKYKADIKRGEELKLLKSTKYYKSIVEEGYLESEASKLFKILTDPSGATPISQDEINLRLAAISCFKGYVGTDDYKGTIEIDAENAPLAIAREEEYRKHVTAEFAERDR